MKAILPRLREPSTYSGLAVLLALCGVALPPGLVEAIAQLGAAIAAVAAIALPEGR